MVRVIAELGMCNNSIEWAHEAVDAAVEAGCWGSKVQMLNRLAAPGTARYDRLPGPATQQDGFDDALPYEAWGEVFDHAREVGLEPFASCWDLEAVEVARGHGAMWFKVGSADITYRSLIEASAEGNLILSTGAATRSEVERAVEWAYRCLRPDTQIVVMACTLSYPTRVHEAQLGRIGELIDMFDVSIGYSDHTRSVRTGGLAVAAGATYLEKHMTVTPGLGGDHDFALTPDQMSAYTDFARQAESMLDDEWLIDSERQARALARRSLHTIAAVEPMDVLVLGVNVDWLRPWNGGIEPWEAGHWVARRALEAGVQVRKIDLA